MRALWLVALVGCGGGTTLSPPPVSNRSVAQPAKSASLDDVPCHEMKTSCAVRVWAHFEKYMCACKDKSCADRVSEKLTSWAEGMSPKTPEKEPLDPELTKRAAELLSHYTECMSKLMDPSEPCGG